MNIDFASVQRRMFKHIGNFKAGKVFDATLLSMWIVRNTVYVRAGGNSYNTDLFVYEFALP